VRKYHECMARRSERVTGQPEAVHLGGFLFDEFWPVQAREAGKTGANTPVTQPIENFDRLVS
jgi:hypothetical protein